MSLNLTKISKLKIGNNNSKKQDSLIKYIIKRKLSL